MLTSPDGLDYVMREGLNNEVGRRFQELLVITSCEYAKRDEIWTKARSFTLELVARMWVNWVVWRRFLARGMIAKNSESFAKFYDAQPSLDIIKC